MDDRNTHVLLLYRAMIPSVRLCGHCQMEVLAQKELIEYRAKKISEVKTKELRWADVVLIGRLDYPEEMKICQKLQKDGKYLVYILDDDLLNIPDTISSYGHYYQTNIRESILSMIGMSRALLTPSPFIYEKYAAKEMKCLLVEEPALDPIAYSQKGINEKISIGLAGSIDRIGDIERILKDALLRIKQEYGERIRFCFFGAVPSFAEDLDAEKLPYCDSYDQYRKTLNKQKWDIGLAPMPESDFHACKHYNKYVEYAAAGIAGIYSEVLPYTRMKGKLKGATYTQNTPDAWYNAIRDLIEDSEKREWLRRTVCNEARGILSLETSAEKLYEQMTDIIEYRAPKSNVSYHIRLKKCEIYIRKILNAAVRYKWRLPIRMIEKVMKTFR